MRPSHLVIDGGEPPLLKITVWLGNKAADKYRLAPLFGRADVGEIPHGHRWDLPRSEFAPDSPLEGRVSCELVSENAKFPASWEYTGNFIDSGLGGASMAAKNDIKSVPYGPIP
jgi:hypothetical protein